MIQTLRELDEHFEQAVAESKEIKTAYRKRMCFLFLVICGICAWVGTHGGDIQTAIRQIGGVFIFMFVVPTVMKSLTLDKFKRGYEPKKSQ